MKISLNWIKDYVNLENIDVDWLTGKFTITTAEIEEVHKLKDDVIIEIDNKSLTHRPDLWCHFGIAREIAAITGRELKAVDCISWEELKGHRGDKLNIEILDREKCLRYSAVKIDKVKPCPSPDVIAERLLNCGIRPINIIVDLANYVMLDIGQPLHTFDSRDIDCIRVASLGKPVRFQSLDSVMRELPSDTLIIGNGDKPLAIAGIIGGDESAVSESTEAIILESATFEGTALRKTAAALSIRTDASARYEKFLDTALTPIALGRFLKLLKIYQHEIELASSVFDEVIREIKPIKISLEHKYIETYLGEGLDKNTVMNILRSLYFEVEEKEGAYDITVPTFRATKDVTGKADIIEEILRMYGYDKIKGKSYKAETACPPRNEMKEMEYSLKDLLVKKFNFNEVHSYSWYDNNWLKKIGQEYSDALKIVNSGVKQFEKLRTDLMPNLLKAAYDNRKSYEEIRIFEIGRTFTLEKGELRQPKHLTAVYCSSKDEEYSYRYIKGICSYLLKNLKNIDAKYVEVKSSLKENCLVIDYNGHELGSVYSVPSAMLKLFGSNTVINILDIDLELLGKVTKDEIKYKPLSKYPDTYLDFSILTSKDMSYSDIEVLTYKFRHPLILETEYVDTYSGENVPEDMKSTTMRITIGHPGRTLQLEEINEVKGLFINYLNINGLDIR